jgi:MFS family permease|tara:strand:+ start:3411 stop:4616 length:1206 start_codon:yes stop_codon:yes gene_type:complete
MEEKLKILILSCIGISFGWMPWFNFSAVIPILQDTYNLSSNNIGTILGAFQIGYVVSVLITGLLTYKIRKKTILVVSSLIVGLSSIGFAFFSTDFNSILFWRFIVGLGCGGLYAPGLALLANWFPPDKRGMAFGAYTGAGVTAYASGYFIAAPLAAISGWQMGIIATSLPALLAIFVFFLIDDRLQSTHSLSYNSKFNWKQLSFFPLIVITIAYMSHMWEQFAFWGWVGPFYTVSGIVLGIEQMEALTLGGIMAAVTIIAGIFSPWLGGMASDKFGRLSTAILFSLLSALLSFIIGWLVGYPLLIIILVGIIYGFVVAADSAIYKVGISEVLPKRHIAMGLAIQSAFGFGAAIFSPKVFGMILDLTNATSIQTNWGWSFVSLGIGGLISPLFLILLIRMRK